ncbi:MAG: hypothetical protein Q9M36_05865 [Sulfurovum sp.]|nr:hypothetical protein [Sulfurovum sp.]
MQYKTLLLAMLYLTFTLYADEVNVNVDEKLEVKHVRIYYDSNSELKVLTNNACLLDIVQNKEYLIEIETKLLGTIKTFIKLREGLEKETFHITIFDSKHTNYTWYDYDRVASESNDLKKLYGLKSLFNKVTHRNKNYGLAINIAKSLFDTSYRLSIKTHSIYSLDKDAITFLMKINPNNKHLVALIAKHETVEAYLSYYQQEIANFEKKLYLGKYKEIKEIKRLIDNKKYSEAQLLNTSLLAMYEEETRANKAMIVKNIGINMILLQNNQKYIKTLQEEENLL